MDEPGEPSISDMLKKSNVSNFEDKLLEEIYDLDESLENETYLLKSTNVFKVFVANPKKPPEIIRILADNKIKLTKYLSGLHRDREGKDEQFREEKALVLSTLEALE